MTGSVPSRQINLAYDNATVIAAQGGGRVDVHQRIGTHLIDELSFGTVPPLADEQPSRLLNPANRVVRFTGRKQEVAELEAWRDDSAAVAVRLMHGGAGQGKTRLAHRFAERSSAAGWITLRARHSRDIAVRPIDVQPGNSVVSARPLLVVVDYAERWPLSDLLALLVDRRLHNSRTLRVLLLARPVGNWWHALTHRLSQDLGVDAFSVELAALGATRSDSQNAFEVARACFAEALRVAVPEGPAPDLKGSILTIHMAALAHVLAVRVGDTPPSDPGELSAYLLSRERSHWQSMYDNDRRVESTPQVMGRAVHVAALTRSLDFEAAVVALKSTTVADSAATAGRVLDDHAMCYPPHDPTTVLEPLYPDRLAEDFVALQTPGHRIDGFRSDPWAAGAPRALLENGGGNPATVLPLLIDGARRWPHLPDSQLLPLLRERPELAVQAGSPTLSALAAAPWMPPGILAAIESVLPVDPPADLHAGIAALGERLAAQLPHQTDDPVRTVAALLKRGWRLINSGRITDGVRLLTAAVTTARLLTAEKHPTELERALRVLGRAHVQAENWAAAAATLGEAVGLWNTHGAHVQPPADEIARCLTDLSLALWHQGIGESLAVRHRAIVQLRRLVSTNPRHRLTLARVLVQQAEQFRERDRYRDSLEAIEDAARLLGEVAGDAGTWLEPDFAAALLGRARTLQSLRELTGAAAAASAAVRILGQLARRNVAFDEDLAGALGTEAAVLAGLERWTDAIGAQEKAVSIFRRLSGINGTRYSIGLAQALTDFGRICRDAGRRYDDALRALGAAIELVRSSREAAAVKTRLLVDAESIGADLLDASGRHEEADALRKSTRQRQTRRPPQNSPLAPAREPSSQQRREPEAPAEGERDARHYAREIAVLDPAAARLRLREFGPHNIAVILLAIDPRYEWLAQVFSGFEPVEKFAVLREFVWFDGLTEHPAILRFTGKHLLHRTTEYETAYALSVLQKATPAVVAGVLSHDDWAKKARFVLGRMDPSRATQIIRLLPYDPGKIQYHSEQIMYW